MIKVECLFKNNLPKRITSSGHSLKKQEASNREYLLICNSISVLIQNYAHSLESLLFIPIQVVVKDGFFEINFPESLEKKDSSSIIILTSSFILGVEQLSHQFPDQIALSKNIS